VCTSWIVTRLEVNVETSWDDSCLCMHVGHSSITYLNKKQHWAGSVGFSVWPVKTLKKPPAETVWVLISFLVFGRVGLSKKLQNHGFV
jgi:hypothetical protein